jgi:hypothetical protein
VDAERLILNHSHGASSIQDHQKGASFTLRLSLAHIDALKGSYTGRVHVVFNSGVSYPVNVDRGSVVTSSRLTSLGMALGEVLRSVDGVRACSLLLVIALLEAGLLLVANLLAIVASWFGSVTPLLPWGVRGRLGVGVSALVAEPALARSGIVVAGGPSLVFARALKMH